MGFLRSTQLPSAFKYSKHFSLVSKSPIHNHSNCGSFSFAVPFESDWLSVLGSKQKQIQIEKKINLINASFLTFTSREEKLLNFEIRIQFLNDKTEIR